MYSRTYFQVGQWTLKVSRVLTGSWAWQFPGQGLGHMFLFKKKLHRTSQIKQNTFVCVQTCIYLHSAKNNGKRHSSPEYTNQEPWTLNHDPLNVANVQLRICNDTKKDEMQDWSFKTLHAGTSVWGGAGLQESSLDGEWGGGYLHVKAKIYFWEMWIWVLKLPKKWGQ